MRKAKTRTDLAPSNETVNERIARKAYELYEQRGGGHGHDLADWLAAEQFIQGAISSAASTPKPERKMVSMRRKKVNR